MLTLYGQVLSGTRVHKSGKGELLIPPSEGTTGRALISQTHSKRHSAEREPHKNIEWVRQEKLVGEGTVHPANQLYFPTSSALSLARSDWTVNVVRAGERPLYTGLKLVCTPDAFRSFPI